MKCTVGLIMAVAAIGANAQSFNDLPDCGKTCVQNVIAKASEFGCGADDVACLCKNVNFTYGIRDCSLEACADSAESIINYGAEYCRNEGVVITTEGSDSKTGDSSDATATATATDGSDNSDDSNNGVPIATSTHETVIEESGSSFTSTSVETIYSSSESADASETGSTDVSKTESTDASKTGDATKTESTDKSKPTDADGGNKDDDKDGDNKDGDNKDGNNDDDDAEDNDENGVARTAPAGLLAVAAIAAFFV